MYVLKLNFSNRILEIDNSNRILNKNKIKRNKKKDDITHFLDFSLISSHLGLIIDQIMYFDISDNFCEGKVLI